MSREITQDEINQARFEDWQADQSEKFWEKQNVICRREKDLGLTCEYCEFKTYKVDLDIPF